MSDSMRYWRCGNSARRCGELLGYFEGLLAIAWRAADLFLHYAFDAAHVETHGAHSPEDTLRAIRG